jgi:hypothetical protein
VVKENEQRWMDRWNYYKRGTWAPELIVVCLARRDGVTSGFRPVLSKGDVSPLRRKETETIGREPGGSGRGPQTGGTSRVKEGRGRGKVREEKGGK